VMIQSGSRGFGHQISTDYLKVMERVTARMGYRLPDRQLACAPIKSEDGIKYAGALACGVNYAVLNRQLLTHWVRESFERVFRASARKLGMNIIYDNSHNLALFEEHQINGIKKELCVHRKGATRAFGPGHPDLPENYKSIGQPIVVPGDMGTCSFLLLGTEEAMKESFGSTCHGAGRMMSRSEAKRRISGSELKSALEARGISIMADSMPGLAEEAPDAYKDVSKVVEICVGAGISRKVARMVPIGVLKG
ncbi:tRNA-splicing ligase RtcB (3'-phosphate/5'-hydroxy nucleic acid ligase), partial [Candidatus Hakubella thermalkaliphila]